MNEFSTVTKQGNIYKLSPTFLLKMTKKILKNCNNLKKLFSFLVANLTFFVLSDSVYNFPLKLNVVLNFISFFHLKNNLKSCQISFATPTTLKLLMDDLWLYLLLADQNFILIFKSFV